MMHPSLLLAVSALMLGSVPVQTVQSLPSYDICETSVVNVSPTTSPFNIRSPSYGVANYTDNLRCSLALQSSYQPLVLLFFYRDFNLEPELTCEYDSLCVHGVLYCNNWETGLAFVNILPSHSRSTIIFKTDGSVGRSGFEITVVPQPIVNNQIVCEAKGLGQTDRNIQYTHVRYYPGMTYTDACSDLPVTRRKRSIDGPLKLNDKL
ncbi:hypothetical protein BsWGS_21772 [Bradybaena similaris]